MSPQSIQSPVSFRRQLTKVSNVTWTSVHQELCFDHGTTGMAVHHYQPGPDSIQWWEMKDSICSHQPLKISWGVCVSAMYGTYYEFVFCILHFKCHPVGHMTSEDSALNQFRRIVSKWVPYTVISISLWCLYLLFLLLAVFLNLTSKIMPAKGPGVGRQSAAPCRALLNSTRLLLAGAAFHLRATDCWIGT